MNETIFKYFTALKKGEIIPESRIPTSLFNNIDFKNLCRTNIIIKKEKGAGYVYFINEEKQSIFNKFYKNTFPDTEITEITKASNIARFKNSKSRQVEIIPIAFLKGWKKILLNNEFVDLKEFTEKFGLFSATLINIQTEKICIVENKYLFLEIEKIIDTDYVFLHPYGRIGKELLKSIKVEEILVVSDYDYVGLNEYLKFKEYNSDTKFYVPPNYDYLFETYADYLTKNKNKKGQILSKYPRVANSNDKVVVKIREQVKRTQKFLEQEILLYECKR